MSSVYTPGLVANGREWRGWFRSPVLDTGGARRAGNLAIRVRGERLEARFEPVRVVSGLELNVAVLGFDLSTEVKAGENHGRTLKHDFVVLGHETVSMRADGAAQVAELTLPRPNQDSSRYGVAAWVSVAGSHTPLQATGGMLEK